MANTMGDVTSAERIGRWPTIIFAVAAGLQAIDGLSTLPSLGGGILAALALAALFLIATGRTRYALFAMAAALLAVWLGVVASADPAGGEASPGTLLLFVGLPLIAATVAVLAWRGTRLMLAALLASLPTLLSIVAAFLLALVMA